MLNLNIFGKYVIAFTYISDGSGKRVSKIKEKRAKNAQIVVNDIRNNYGEKNNFRIEYVCFISNGTWKVDNTWS